MIEAGLAACGVRIVIKIIMHKLESSPLGLDFFFMLLVGRFGASTRKSNWPLKILGQK